jgi:KDO2-lipid IV(A) lauroyltransferase
MAKPRNDPLDRALYITMRVISIFFHWWPVDANLKTARIVGSIWFATIRHHRNRALDNIRRAYPEMSEKQVHNLARASIQHLFMLGMEVLFTPRLIRIDTFRNYVDLGKDFQQTLQLLMARNKGLIVLTGHYGNWEILGYVLATLGFETATVARPIDNPYCDDWVFGVRARQGQRMIDKRGATTELTQLLEEGGCVAFVADQNAGSKGLFVDFFGRKASTFKSIGLLAMTYEVPVVVGYSRRMNNRFQFKIATQDIIWPADWKDQDDPLRYITQRYTSAIEQFAREEPTQYLWVHRRWKSRPKNEKPEPEKSE